MIRTLASLALAAIALFGAGPAFAQADPAAEPEGGRGGHHRQPPTAEERARWDQRRKEWEAMTPEQREAKRQEMRAKREANMTPEQRARMEERRKAWEAMSPEEREAKRREMHERRAQRRQRKQ